MTTTKSAVMTRRDCLRGLSALALGGFGLFLEERLLQAEHFHRLLDREQLAGRSQPAGGSG